MADEVLDGTMAAMMSYGSRMVEQREVWRGTFGRFRSSGSGLLGVFWFGWLPIMYVLI